MVREIRGVLSLAPTVKGSWRVPILKTEAARGEGVRARLAVYTVAARAKGEDA